MPPAFTPASSPDESPAPEYGPGTPQGTGRASFGFTAGPISPRRDGPPEPVSPSWPPPARLDPGPSERVSGGVDSLRGPSGSHRVAVDSLRGPSGSHRTAVESPRGSVDSLRGPSGSHRIAAESPRGPIDSLRGPSGENRIAERPPATLPPRQSRGVTVGIVLLSVIVLVLGSIAGVAYFSGSDDDIDSVLQLGAGQTANGRTVSAPLDNRSTASFELLAGANTVHVTIGELGDDLYRISTPDDAGILPNPTIRNDAVTLQVTKDGDGTGGEIEVVLAAKVRWQLRFSGYAEKQVIDVSGGQVSGIEMVAGMKQAQLTLARPIGTVPLKINGAVDSLILKSPADNPIRIKVGGGAQTVIAGSRTLKNVAAGSTLTPKGWDTTNRYDVTAGARITSLTVENA